MRLTGAQHQALHKAIVSAYDEPSLEQALLFRLNIRLWDNVERGAFRDVVFRFILWAEHEGSLSGVLESLKDDRRTNEKFVKACDALLAALKPTAGAASPQARKAVASSKRAPLKVARKSIDAAKQKVGEIDRYLQTIAKLLPRPDADDGLRSIFQPMLASDSAKAASLRLAFGFPKDPERSAQLYGWAFAEEHCMRPLLGIFAQRVHMLMWRFRYTVSEIARPWAKKARALADEVCELCEPQLPARQPTLRLFSEMEGIEVRLQAMGEPAPDEALYAALRALDHATHFRLPDDPATVATLRANALTFVHDYLNDLIQDARQVEDSSNAWWALREGLCERDPRFLELLPRVAQTFKDVRIVPEHVTILAPVPEIFRPIRTACYMLSNIQAVMELGDYIPDGLKPILHNMVMALLDRLLASPRSNHLYLASVHHEGLRNYLDYVRDQKLSIVSR